MNRTRTILIWTPVIGLLFMPWITKGFKYKAKYFVGQAYYPIQAIITACLIMWITYITN